MLYLKKIDSELRQPFLDETAAQIEAKQKTRKPIKNPIAYLCWLSNEHRNGNTLLTSLGIRYRDNRIRQANTERQFEKKTTISLDVAADKALQANSQYPRSLGTIGRQTKIEN